MICLFFNLFVFVSLTAVAQNGKKLYAFNANSYLLKPDSIAKPHTVKTAYQQLGLLNNMTLKTLPADYYAKHIGFFCGKELQLEKTTKIPLRFRLGSLEYCNVLEGKNR